MILIFCQCDNSDIITASEKERISRHLEQEGIEYMSVPDLCGALARREQAVADVMRSDELTVVACYPRAVKGLMQSAGLPLDGRSITFINMREQSVDEVIERLPDRAEPIDARLDAKTDWRPWFPIIDEGRCTHCGQCLDFCLFGVYQRDAERKVRVVQPANCKNKCPACARICPQVAIMFPKLEEAPLNGAEIVSEADAQARVKLNIDEMLGEDIYAALEKRKVSRKKLLKKQELDKALEERAACADESECDCDCDCGPESDCCSDCKIKCFNNKS